ncbi:MAG TPA: putative glycolipid-binding domain-containing protein [Thermoleophilaceae bacterium]
MTRRRLLVWRGLEEWLAETADVQLDDGRLTASGTQLGEEPIPYRLDYELTTGDRWVTERVTLTARGDGWDRRLTLARSSDGGWSGAIGDRGELPGPLAGLDHERTMVALADVHGALDCDIAFSPLTNAMPILRDGLLVGGEPREYLMAWISVPDLAVTPSPQRYEPIDDRHVRFASLDSDFTADLELDADGLVLRYPRLAERV